MSPKGVLNLEGRVLLWHPTREETWRERLIQFLPILRADSIVRGGSQNLVTHKTCANLPTSAVPSEPHALTTANFNCCSRLWVKMITILWALALLAAYMPASSILRV